MKYQSNRTMMEDPDRPPPQGPFPVWSKVFTKPGEQTFIEITSHPDARARSAYIWVFAVGTLAGLINSLTQFVLTFAQLQNLTAEAGGLPGSPGVFGTAGLLSALCFAPITGIFLLSGFAMGVSIIHGTARFLGGQGSFDKLAYAIGAILVPVTLISAFLIPFNAIPYVIFCTGPLLLVINIYMWYLEVAAIKAVHQLGWGEAAGAFFLPTLLAFLSCGVLVLLTLRMTGLSINDIMEQLQRGVP